MTSTTKKFVDATLSPPGQETMVKVAVAPTFLKSKAELTKGSVSRLRFLLLAGVTGLHPLDALIRGLE